MAELDTLIRFTARKQVKRLTTAARQRHDRLLGMAARAKDKEAKARYKHLAKSMLEHATAAARRLETSAENTADAFARSMKKVAEEAEAMKPAKKAAAKKAAKTKD
jgi:hypothetical protein